MNDIDPEEIRRKLSETYERMSDEELSSVADDGYDLTDLAREMLQAEIRKRKLDIQLKIDPPPADLPPAPLDISDLDTVSVVRVWDIHEARRVKAILDDLSIPSSLEDGVELKVLRSDYAKARSALAHLALPETEVEGDLEDAGNTVVCPKCQSPDIVLQGDADDPTPSADPLFNWICDSCGHQWKDDGIEKTA